ncbi:hypothetical protein WJX74_004173 [Apatococcus lobatus]|uniref:Uncharacterized protein n=1 Tax=Apatococcus lobatus TaxID=904363 RepID=A0AAW1S1D0_9CHLO
MPQDCQPQLHRAFEEEARAAQRAAKAAKEETLLWKAEAARLQQDLTKGPGKNCRNSWQQHNNELSAQHKFSLLHGRQSTSPAKSQRQSSTAREVSHVYELMAMHCQTDELHSKCLQLQNELSAAQRELLEAQRSHERSLQKWVQTAQHATDAAEAAQAKCAELEQLQNKSEKDHKQRIAEQASCLDATVQAGNQCLKEEQSKVEQECRLRTQAEEHLQQWHRNLVVPLAQWAGQYIAADDMDSQQATEQMATLALASSSCGAMQEPGVQCWLHSAVPNLRRAINCQQSQFKQIALLQEQAQLDIKRHAEAQVIAARASEASAWTEGHKAGIAEQAALLKQHQTQLIQVREEGQFQIQNVQQQLQQARDNTQGALRLADQADARRMQQASKLEADTARAEQKALDLEQQLRDVTLQLHAIQEEQDGSSSNLQESFKKLQAQHEQQESRAQAAEVKLAGTQAELQRSLDAEKSASRHWELERDAVKTALQQLEHEQSRSREQSIGLAQAHAQAAATRHEIDSLQKEAQQSHTIASQAKGALAQLQGKLESLQQRQLDLQLELDLEMQKPLMPGLIGVKEQLSVFTP